MKSVKYSYIDKNNKKQDVYFSYTLMADNVPKFHTTISQLEHMVAIRDNLNKLFKRDISIEEVLTGNL